MSSTSTATAARVLAANDLERSIVDALDNQLDVWRIEVYDAVAMALAEHPGEDRLSFAFHGVWRGYRSSGAGRSVHPMSDPTPGVFAKAS